MKHSYLHKTCILKPFLAFWVAAFLALPVKAKILYVDANATGAADGLTWINAFTDLQKALDVGAYAVGDTVWVATGTYKPTSTVDRSISFHVRNGLVILGGFQSGDLSVEDRDYTANQTVLSGDIGILGLSTDNTYHVVDGTWGDSSAILDGFYITQGHATFRNGGGMYTFDGAPGGTGEDGPMVRNCLFYNNYAEFNGGGMYNHNSPATVINCTFLNNKANEGGGMFNGTQSDATIIGCIFRQDSAVSYGGGMHNYYSDPLISNCLFESNYAQLYGGGMTNWTDNVSSGQTCDPIIVNCQIRGNVSAGSGGGMGCNRNSAPQISNCLFSGNVAADAGGGLAVFGNNSDPTLINCTFSGNYANRVGGFHYASPTRPTVYNCILYGNSDALGVILNLQQISAGSITADHNLIEGVSAVFGTNNFSADPLFISPITPLLPTTAGDFHVSLYSPVINAGLNVYIPKDLADGDQDGNKLETIDFDLDLDPRIENDTVDVGVYESLTLCLPLGSSTLFTQPIDSFLCQGESTQLCIDSTGALTALNWSTGDTTQCITVDTTGLYIVRIADTTGWTAYDTVLITVFKNPDPQTVPGDTVPMCTGDTVSVQTFLTYSQYLWSNGDITQMTEFTMGGIAAVTVTDSNGCQGMDTLLIIESPLPTPVITANGPLVFCAGDSVNLTVSQTYPTYTWSSGEPSQGISVFSSGTYIVTVVDTNLCVNSDTAIVTVNPLPVASIIATDSLEFCDGDSVLLDAGMFDTYLWSTGDTTQNITAFTSGTYSVIVSDTFGCMGFDTAVVIVNLNPIPTIIPSSSPIFCDGDSIILDGGNYTSYLWSTGATSDTLIVKLTGNYILTVTDAKGCLGKDTLTVSVGNNPTPTITPSKFPTICDGDSVILDAGNYAHYLWSTSDTSQTITVTTANTYTVTVTTAQGCSGMDTLSVTVNPNPNPTISINGTTRFCEDRSRNLNADPSNLYTSYLWSTGQNSKIINVDTTANYWVQVTDANGCFAFDTISILVDTIPNVVITPIGDTVFCDGDSVILDPGGFYVNYFWSTAVTTQTIKVKTSGTYAVFASNSFGCFGRASIPVVVVPNPSNFITASGSLSLCPGDSVILDGANGNNYTSYLWNTGDTTRFLTVKTAGTFILNVTDALGCTGADTVVTTISGVLTPTISLSGSPILCAGDTLTLDAGTFPNYLWNTSETTQTIKVTTGGTYIVDVVSSGGCTGSDTVVITLVNNPNPSISAGGPTTVCDGDSVLLSVGSFASYLWSTGSINDSITVGTSGTYLITVTDTNNCQGVDSISVIVNPKPIATISTADTTTFCAGDSAVLDAGIHDHYVWSGGDTTQMVTAKTSGIYQVIVTNNSGCSDTTEITITVRANPVPNIVPSRPTTFCMGDSTQLDPGIFSSYLWSTGATSRKITALTSGIYTVTVTNTNGCTGADSETVTANPNPTPSITPSGPISFCQGDSSTLNAGAYSSYLWSTGATSQNITVFTSNMYWVRVTDVNGCQGTDTVMVTVNANPTPSITVTGTTTFCEGDSAILDAGIYASYLWSDMSVGQTRVAKTTGLYKVTVSNINGCTASDSVEITVNTNPFVTISPSSISNEICEGDSVQLDGGAHNYYLWSTGDTTQQIWVSIAGNYSLVVTNTVGCTDTDTTQVIVNANPIPNILATGDTTFCDGDSVMLNAGTGYSGYSWVPTGAITQNITVKITGLYKVTVVDANGCIGKDSIQVTSHPNPNTLITPLGSTNICPGDSLILSAGPTGTYLWSTGQVSQTISVKTQGIFWVDVTTAAGCTARDSISITVSSSLSPTITALGPLTFCEGDNIILDAGSGYANYSWNTTPLQTTQTILVDSAFSYILTVFDASGCSGMDTATVMVNPNPLPLISANGPTTFCDGDSVKLDAGPYTSFNWSNGDTTQTITVKTGGSYHVNVTDINGCSGADTILVIVHSNPIVNITPAGSISSPIELCEGSSQVLNGGSHPGATYLWSTTQISQNITVSTSGSYILTVTDSNGCIAKDTAWVTVHANPIPVIIPIGGPTSFCQGDSVILDAGDYVSHSWNTGPTSQLLTVNISGQYIVTVVDTNGCEGMDTMLITVFSNPVVTITPPGITEICAGDTLTLNGGLQPPGSGYLWSTGATSQTIKAATSGNYSLTVTDFNNCVGYDTVTVKVNPIPNPTIIAGGPTTLCPGGSLVLDPGIYSGYLWSTGATSRTITVTTGGTFSVTVTDTNGCKGIDSILITMGPPIMPTITSNGPTTFCDGDSVVLDAGMYSIYSWSTGPNTRTLTVKTSGLYIVTVTDVMGCIGTDSIQVTVNPNPTPIIVPNKTVLCEGDSASLNAGFGYTQYSWSPGGQITQFIKAKTTGTYIVTVTNANGCTGVDSIFILVNSRPVPDIKPLSSLSVCFGDSVILSTTRSWPSYLWSPSGATSQSITVKSTQVVYVTVTDSNGCKGKDSVNVGVNPNLTPMISSSSGTTLCFLDTSTLNAGPFPNYLWSTGATTQRIKIHTAGTYKVTVWDNNGCMGVDSIVITQVQNLNPVIAASGPLIFCSGDSVVLSVMPFATYNWRPNGQSTQSITIKTGSPSGRFFSVAVTDSNNCKGISAPVKVIVYPTPNGTIAPSDTSTLCDGDTLLLYAGNYPSVQWSTGSTDSTIQVVMNATLSVTVTDTNGCTGMDTYIANFKNNPIPMITTQGNSFICPGDSITLNAGIYSHYLWSTGASNQSITRQDSGYFSVMVTDSNGCNGVDSFYVKIVEGADVNILSTVNGIPGTTGCYGQPIVLTTDSAFVSYGWSTGQSTRNISAFYQADTSVYFNVMVVDSNGCRDTDSVTIRIHALPNPTITASGPLTSCTADSLTLDAGPFNAFQWSTGAVSRFIKANVLGDTTLYLVIVTDLNGCQAIDTIRPHILQSPFANFMGLDSTYCENAPPDTLSGTPGPGTFLGTGVTGKKFDPAVAGPGIYTIKYAHTAPNGCVDTAKQVTRIFPVGVNTNFNVQAEICDSDVPIRLAATPVGGNFIGSGVYFSPADTAYYFSPYRGPGYFPIQYIIQGGDGCTDSTLDSILVKSTLPIDITGLDSVYCLLEGDALGHLPGSLPPPNNPRFTSKLNNVDILGGWGAVNKGLDSIFLTYVNGNNCISRDTAYTLVVAAPPIAFTNIKKTFCQNDLPVLLGANPSGGSFSHDTRPNAVVANTFIPDSANIGLNIINYSYHYYPKPAFACDTVITDSFWVNSKPLLSISPLKTIFCPDGDTLRFTGNFTGGAFGGPGIDSTGLFDPKQVSPGNHVLTYTYTDPFTCSDTLFHSIYVDSVANLSFVGLDTAYCIGTPGITLTASPGGGSFTGNGVFNGILYPDSIGASMTSTITYNYANATTGCPDQLDMSIRINPLPNVTFEPLDSADFCVTSGINKLLTGLGQPMGGPSTGYFFGPLVVSGSRLDISKANNPPNMGAGTYPVSYRFKDMNGCADTVTQYVNLFNFPALSVFGPNGMLLSGGTNYFFCEDDAPFQMAGMPGGGKFGIKSPGPDSAIIGDTFYPALAVDSFRNSNIVYYVYDDSIGCSDSLIFNFYVETIRSSFFTNLDTAYCASDTSTYLFSVNDLKLGDSMYVKGQYMAPPFAFSPADLGVGLHAFQFIDYDSPTTGVIICPDTLTQWVEIKDNPIVNFTGLAASYCDKQPSVQLSGFPAGVNGNFSGPGILGNSNIFEPTKANMGLNVVTYTYTDETGCTNSFSQTSIVGPAPEGNFVSNNVCLGDQTIFTYDNAKPTLPNFQWAFGNGDTAFTPAPKYIYPDTGTYGVQLITRVGTCTDTSFHEVTVYPVPTADFFGDDSVYLGDMAYFFNTSTGGTKFVWEFGDGGVSMEDSMVEYLYTKIAGQPEAPWNYEIMIVAENEYFCTDSAYRSISVTERPSILYEEGIYPNPTDGSNLFVNIYLNEPLDIVLEFYDVRGRKVNSTIFTGLETGLNSLEVEMGNIAEGMYVLSVLAGNNLLGYGDRKPGSLSKHKIRYNRFRKVIVTH